MELAMAKIYVSSTFNDLQEYREQVRTSLRSMGHEDIAMEYYTAGEQRPAEKCLEDVDASDIYVGIFALVQYYRDDPQTLPLLHEHIAKDEDPGVRRASISALVENYRDDPQTLPLLHEHIAKDEDLGVRSAAVSALAQYYREDSE